MKNRLSRRQFIRFSTLATASAAVSLGFLGCSRALIQKVPGFGPEPPYEFMSSPNQLLDLPEGFTAHAFSRTGEQMDDGLWVPGNHDGMAAYPGPDGKTILVRNHELKATDKTAGAFGWNNEKIERAVTDKVYQTEDRGDSLIFRFIPEKPGELAAGGKLQALKIRDMKSADTRNWRSRSQKVFRWTYSPIPVGETLAVEWVDIENVESPDDDLRVQGTEGKDAAKFARGEGIWYGSRQEHGEFYIACTNGGIAYKGQIWRYIPSPYEGTSREEQQPGTLQLFIEPNDSNLLENADNLTITPWGDLIICEDGPNEEFLIGVTPEGNLYRFARNAGNLSELAGATFSPDGTTLFVNIQSPGITLAITGPWHEIRQRPPA